MPDITIDPFPSWGAEKDEECAWIADRILHHLLPAATALHRANAVELGLDPAELAIVEVLGTVRALRLTAVADRVALSHAATSRATSRLAERTWVDRCSEVHGYVEITRAEGTTAVLAASLQDVRSPLAAAVEALAPADRATVLRFLDEVVEIITVRARSRGDRRLERTLVRRRREWLRDEW
ncbi:MarR family transcriptional regulator [Actinomycetospora termitidis]|uniref:Helix-turn-helix domain-containing protein n=1 Tax=Actinomycetospora termitidis TaxID=3053470 RepID=A0ABT7MBG5_9PSEU|nr:helix-turn-helix domain-containing protein [Actinomycetospora sp. Odt1-22]MDL5158010.1 helix-turn-helix domain-containing protein [Actinomycetospora sp. Odt1-22]